MKKNLRPSFLSKVQLLQKKFLPLTYKTGFFALLALVVIGSSSAAISYKRASTQDTTVPSSASLDIQQTTQPIAQTEDANTNQQPSGEPTPTSSGGTQSTRQTSGNQNSQQSPQNQPAPAAPTPAPAPTTPTLLSTCVYTGSPHNGENCPYNAPPAWNGSFTKYVCMNYYNMVACPGYRDMTQMIYGMGVEYHDSEIYKGYAGRCVFRTTKGDIQRIVYVNANGATSGEVDCLTAQPL